MDKLYKPMVPTLVDQIPQGSDWIYEVKYDGFRSILYIVEDRIELISRNLKNISSSFPEVISEIKENFAIFAKYAPLILDGELVILDSPFRANFEKIQVRGRTKLENKIDMLVNDSPARFLAFDIVMINGNEVINKPLVDRKELLTKLFLHLQTVNLMLVDPFCKWEQVWDKVKKENGEGIVGKRLNSKWMAGVRTTNWLKIKNWKKADFVIISLEKQNDYFHVGLVKDNEIVHVGLFSHGLKEEERSALKQIIKANAVQEDAHFIYINPSICVELFFLDWYKSEIRQPRFSMFKLAKKWEECTWEEARICTMKLL